VGAGGCVWGWACERRLWGGWALVPVFNLVMGFPLKVACSEATIALGDAAAAATYLSAGFKLFRFDGGGGCAGGFSGGVGCGVWRGWCGWWFWGFCFLPRLICWRRDLRVALRGRLVDGGGGWRFSLRRERGGGRPAGFLLGACGGRRLGGVVVLRLEAGVARRGAPRLVSRGVGGRVALAVDGVARRVCRSCRVGWRWGDFRMRRRLRGDDLCRRICPRSACLRASAYTRQATPHSSGPPAPWAPVLSFF
jgi:hypothetical protein